MIQIIQVSVQTFRGFLNKYTKLVSGLSALATKMYANLLNDRNNTSYIHRLVQFGNKCVYATQIPTLYLIYKRIPIYKQTYIVQGFADLATTNLCKLHLSVEIIPHIRPIYIGKNQNPKKPGFFVVPFTLPEKPIAFGVFGTKSACAKKPESHTCVLVSGAHARLLSTFDRTRVVRITSRAAVG